MLESRSGQDRIWTVGPTGRAVVWAVLAIAISSLYVPRLIELFPLSNDVQMEASIDDWMVYHEFAKNVIEEGLTIPGLARDYERPLGFGYVYFVALMYTIFGVNSEAVYVVQGFLLLAFVGAMYLIFRKEFSYWAGLVFLCSVAVFMWIDVYRYLTFRLLSENFLIPLLPLLLFFVLRGRRTGSLAAFAIAGVACGLCVLARPNVAFFAPGILATIWLAIPERPRAWRVRACALFAATTAALVLLLPLRNYAVTGNLTAGRVARPSGTPLADDLTPNASLTEVAREVAVTAAKRGAYVIGIPQFIAPEYRTRPHWLLMWAAFGVYLLHLRWRSPAFWEVLVLALCVCYFVPLFAVAYISNYGTRMLAPGVPLILLLSCKGAELTLRAMRQRFAG
jgi:hypothetical protein